MDEQRKERLRQLIDEYETMMERWESDRDYFLDTDPDALRDAETALHDELGDDAVLYRETFYAPGNSMEYEVDVVRVRCVIL